MATSTDVEYWVLEYACRYHHYNVIQGILRRHNESLAELEVPPIRLALPTLMNIITNNRLEEFSLAIGIVENIYKSCEKLVPFRLFAQLTSALKIKALFHLLIADREFVLEKLNQYFPRSGLGYSHANKKTLSQLNSSSFEFRKFFLPILANEKQRLSFLKSDYQKEFGENFLTRIGKLMKQFVTAIEDHLPLTTLEQLIQAVSSGVDVETKLTELGVQSARIEIILDAVTNQTKLDSATLLEILTMVSPISSQDRVVPPGTMAILADHQDSEDSGTDQSPPVYEDKEMTLHSGKQTSDIRDLTHIKHDSLVEERLAPSLDYIEDDNTFTNEYLPGVRAGADNTNEELLTNKSDLPMSSGRDRLRLHSCRERDKSRNGCGSAFDLSPLKGENCVKFSQRHPQTGFTSPSKVCQPQHQKGEKRKNSSNAQSTKKSEKTFQVIRQNIAGGNSWESVASRNARSVSVTDESTSEDSLSSELELEEWSERDVEDFIESSQLKSRYLGGSLSDIDRSSQYDTGHDDTESDSDVISGSDKTSSHVSSSGEIKTDGKVVLSEKDILSQLISPYRKNSVLKLCVVKLYKKQKVVLQEETGEADYDLYS